VSGIRASAFGRHDWSNFGPQYYWIWAHLLVPVIQEKLSWAWRNRDQIEGTGMGLVALTEVLVTLAGEQALPFLEPFTQDKNEWVRHYACRAKEYIQQGKVFVFAPYF
jgi:hypothetical protein